MLGILASLALMAGQVSSTMVLSEEERLVAEQTDPQIMALLATATIRPVEEPDPARPGSRPH